MTKKEFKELLLFSREKLITMSNSVNPIGRIPFIIKMELDNASMYVGKIMQYGNVSENPYKENDGSRKTVEDIKEKVFNTSKTIPKEILDKGEIYTIDWMREEIQDIIDVFSNLDEEYDEEVRDKIMLTISYISFMDSLMKSRMWLGVQLGEIRNNIKTKA